MASALLSGVLACIVAAGLADLPYPISLDLDSAYLAFFAIAEDKGLVAGVDYIFTYGPLAPWYLPIDFDATLAYGMALRAVTAVLAVAVFCAGSTVPRGLLLSTGVIYVMFLDHNAPVLVTILALTFAFMNRSWVLGLLLVALATVWGLVKFSGTVGLYLFLAYYLIAATMRGRSTFRETAVVAAGAIGVHLAVLVAVYVLYLGQSPLHYLDYINRSFEIAQGYSQFMRSGDRRWSLIAYLVVIAAVFVWHWRTLHATELPSMTVRGWLRALDWRALALASCAAPVLFIALKQGYTRQDGHEVAGYIAAFVYASFVANSVRLPIRILVPAQMIVAVGVALGVQATQVQDLRAGVDAFVGRLSSTWPRARDILTLVDAGRRQAAAKWVGDRNGASLAELRRSVPLVPQLERYDIFRPDQTLALLNPDQYRPRPIFQGYSAYTPALQDLNARHVERVPEQFLVNFGVVDRRFPNLDDGSALAQIVLQFCPDEWYGSHLVVRRTGPAVELSELQGLEWIDGSLISGDEIGIPPGVLLGRVNVELTMLGRLASAVYRLPEIRARLELSDGRTQYARLIPTGRDYPAILSPWLESTADLARLWSGEPGATVSRMQLRASRVLRLLVRDVTISYARFDGSSVARKCAEAPSVAEPPPPGAAVYEAPRGAFSLEGIDAHPDSVVAIPIGRVSRLSATLKLRSPAFTVGKSDGVDVRIYGYQRGVVTPILARRVSAGEFASAGSLQLFDGPLAADGGYIVLETSDGDRSWDWFEWGHIKFH